MIGRDAANALQRRASARARATMADPATMPAPAAHEAASTVMRGMPVPLRGGAGATRAHAPPLRMRIDRITFEGIDVPPYRQGRLLGAIEQELARLWRGRDRAPHAGERDRVRGAGVRSGDAIDVDAMGIAIAHSVHASLDGGEDPGA